MLKVHVDFVGMKFLGRLLRYGTLRNEFVTVTFPNVFYFCRSRCRYLVIGVVYNISILFLFRVTCHCY